MKKQLKGITLLLFCIWTISNVYIQCDAESVRLLDSMPEIDIGEYAIVNNGANVTISCDKLDENADDYAWQFKGVDLQFTGFVAQDPYSRIHQYSSGEITVLKIDEEYMGDYRCTAVTQGSPGVTGTSTLEVSLGCPSGCEGDAGEEGYIGRRGPEGAPGAQGVAGVCYPEQCPRPGIGEKGDPGPDGVKGEIGANGEKGEMGNKGDPGEDGVNGMKGERGSIGDDGPKGISGDIGEKGERGNAGDKGVTGATGNVGVSGEEGDKGRKGVAGTGSAGDLGDQGEQGLLGSKGVRGDDGESGDKGFDGQKGEIGENGLKGSIGVLGPKGQIGKVIMKLEIDSINNPDCNSAEYEEGQIIYDTAIDQFIYCDGITFQCIRDRPCLEVGEPPSLSYTSGTYNAVENTEYLVGAVSDRNEGSSEAVYVLASNQTDFTLYSQLRTGTTPVNVVWYYSMAKGDSQRVDLGAYANPNGDTSLARYELQRNIWQEGYYYVNVSNAYGYDYQYAKIVFLPRWSHGWESGAGSFIIDRSVGFFGENLRINADSELRLTEYVVQGTRDWTITYFVNGELVAAQYGPSNTTIYNEDFMIEFTGDRYTLVLSSYQPTYSETYTAYVSNAYGSDSVTSTIETELLVTCNPDPNTSNNNNCACSRENDRLVYTLFGHSFPEGRKLYWVVKDGENNKINALSQIVTISGTMSFMLAANEYCNNGPATVSAQIESQAEIRFTCNCDVDCPDAACCERRDMLIKSTCGENFADIFVLVDVSSSMEPKNEFIVKFIPMLEYDLRQTCIGESNNFTKQNQYKFVAFGGVGERVLPYFVGPDYDLIRDCSESPFAVDVICNSSGCISESIRQLRARLPADGDTEDGYAATKFALSNCARRENALTIVFLLTDEPKGYPYTTFNALTNKSFYESFDQGKSLYTQFLLNNNVIQISLLNTNLVAKDENNDSVQCIGINSEFKCSYANAITNEIQETRRDVRADLQGSQQRQKIADDYIIPALNASGFIFDLNLLRLGSDVFTNAISEALRKEVGFRALLDISECKSCLCLLGENVECSSLAAGKVTDNCKCLQTIRNETVFQNDPSRQENFCNCLIEDKKSTKYCRCRFEDGLSNDQCTSRKELEVV